MDLVLSGARLKDGNGNNPESQSLTTIRMKSAGPGFSLVPTQHNLYGSTTMVASSPGAKSEP